MNNKAMKITESAFGNIVKTEDIRTNILVTYPYGDITVPDVTLGGGVDLVVARVPDDNFFEGAYWANYGSKPSNDDADVFVVPVFLKPVFRNWCENWAQITHGKFITTESGVIVLDVSGLYAWEGYPRPNKRDYNFDKRRLEKSYASLKAINNRR